MHPAIEQFQSLVSPWIESYDRISCSAVGVYEADKPIILFARILLGPSIRPAHLAKPLNEKLFWGRAFEADFSASIFEKLLSEIAEGKFTLGNMTFNLILDGSRSLSLNHYPGYPPTYTGDQSVPRLPSLFVTGGGRHSILNKFLNSGEQEWHLRSLDPPFTDLSDLYTFYGLPLPSQFGDITGIEVLVKPPVELDARSIVKDGKAHIRVLAAKGANVNDLTVGYRTSGGTAAITRNRLVAESFEWHESEQVLEGVSTVDVGDVPTVQCFLSYSDVGIQQRWIIDPTRLLNPRHATYSAFDPEFVVLNRLLFEGGRTASREFEDGVSMLLGMLGFSVAQHGRSQKLSDAPDIIATCPSGHLAVVECTIGLPDQDDQVAKAFQRATTLRKSLVAAGWAGIQVLPVVVTSLAEAEVGDQKRDAEKRGVAVACLEDIHLAITRVRFPVDADRLFQDAVARLQTSGLMRK